MIVAPTVKFGRKLPQLVGNLLPGQAQFGPAGIECRVQRRPVKAVDHDVRHRPIVPPGGAIPVSGPDAA